MRRSLPRRPLAGPSEIAETKQDETLRARGLEAALASLDARSRRIVEARWLREKDSATLHELAAEFKSLPSASARSRPRRWRK